MLYRRCPLVVISEIIIQVASYFDETFPDSWPVKKCVDVVGIHA